MLFIGEGEEGAGPGPGSEWDIVLAFDAGHFVDETGLQDRICDAVWLEADPGLVVQDSCLSQLTEVPVCCDSGS